MTTDPSLTVRLGNIHDTGQPQTPDPVNGSAGPDSVDTVTMALNATIDAMANLDGLDERLTALAILFGEPVADTLRHAANTAVMPLRSARQLLHRALDLTTTLEVDLADARTEIAGNRTVAIDQARQLERVAEELATTRDDLRNRDAARSDELARRDLLIGYLHRRALNNPALRTDEVEEIRRQMDRLAVADLYAENAAQAADGIIDHHRAHAPKAPQEEPVADIALRVTADLLDALRGNQGIVSAAVADLIARNIIAAGTPDPGTPAGR